MRRAKYEGEAASGLEPLAPAEERNRPKEPLLITMMDLEQVLGSSKTTCFKLVGTGEIESVLLGRKRMPVWESVKAYVARLRAAAKAPMQEAA